ncbi:MAG: hypothetical protein HC902_12830 [Calothrix sp. SM1_5_4]|nr:hypothetical protein [Calothrix sp. SM1_5_4]
MESAASLTAREADELHRRKKRILWNQLESGDQRPPYPVDGVLTNRPTDRGLLN